MLYDTHYQKLHPLLKYQYFFSWTSGPSHYCHGPYFLEMAHNFWKPGAIGPYACSAFPISEPGRYGVPLLGLAKSIY